MTTAPACGSHLQIPKPNMAAFTLPKISPEFKKLVSRVCPLPPVPPPPPPGSPLP